MFTSLSLSHCDETVPVSRVPALSGHQAPAAEFTGSLTKSPGRRGQQHTTGQCQLCACHRVNGGEPSGQRLWLVLHMPGVT